MRGLLVLGVVLIAATSACADQIPQCPTPPGVETRSFPSGLPIVLRSALAEKFGTIALPEEKFDATDVIDTGINRRAIFVWTRTNRWIIATEHGGYGYNDPILAYDLNADKSVARLMTERIAYPETVCSTALALLYSN